MNKKILSGILAFVPLILLIVYIVMLVNFMVEMITSNLNSTNPVQGPEFMITFFSKMFGVMMLLGLVSIVKLVYFLIHITNNKKLDSNERLVWVLVGIFVGTFGFPIYWYLKIWKEEPETLKVSEEIK